MRILSIYEVARIRQVLEKVRDKGYSPQLALRDIDLIIGPAKVTGYVFGEMGNPNKGYSKDSR